jgi:hypothetical protein
VLIPVQQQYSPMPATCRAVTFGRYQMVTVAHLSTVTAILDQWAHVSIGVLILTDVTSDDPSTSGDPGMADFYRDCAANCAPDRNPLTLTERVTCWRAAIDHAGLSDRVDVVALPRPELCPRLFTALFPPSRCDLVFPSPRGGTAFDAGRNQAFATLLRRTIHTVSPPVELHTSAIRRSLVAGDPRWREALAPGVVEVFTNLDGPSRLNFL